MIPTIRIRFQLFGHGINPDEISQYLGIIPTKTWHTGDSIQGTGLRRKNDGWNISTVSCQTYDLEEQLNLMFAKILPKSKEIAELKQKFGLSLEIACDIDVEDEYPCIDLSPECISKMAALGASLDIDII